MPEPPQHAQQQHPAALAEPLLQQRGEIVPPAVFLSKKRQEAEKEVGDQQQHAVPGNKALPIGQILRPVFRPAQGGGQEHHCCFKHKEQQADPQGRTDLAAPAQAGSSALFLLFRQQQDPPQHRGDDHQDVDIDDPGLFGHKNGQQAAYGAGHSGDNVQRIESHWQCGAPHRHKSQHDPCRRIHHLRIGKQAGILPGPLGEGQRNAHQIRHGKGDDQE